MLRFTEVAEALVASKWIYAKTMPQCPHHYTLRKEWQSALNFEDLVTFIRKYGYPERYGGRWYTRLDINEYKYWTMGAPLKDTILINRALIDTVEPYDHIAEAYDELWSTHEAKAEDEALAALIEFSDKNASVLDIGCGTGLFLDLCKPSSYVGIDPSAGMLSRLRARYPSAVCINTKFENAYLDKTFDLIVGLYGSPSYVSPSSLSKRVPQMLSAGGRYFLMFYKTGYVPVTHEKLRVDMPWHLASDSSLSGEVIEFNNYSILRGPVY